MVLRYNAIRRRPLYRRRNRRIVQTKTIYTKPSRRLIPVRVKNQMSNYSKKHSTTGYIDAAINPFKDKTYAKFKYVESYDISISGAPYFGRQQMSGNSLFDPNATGGGSQPYGFDQWATLYYIYRVYGSKIECVVLPYDGDAIPDASNDVSVTILPYRNSDNPFALVSNPVEFGVLPYAKTKDFKVYGSTGKDNKMTHYMSTAKMYGLDPVQVKCNPTYESLMTTNPATRWYWNIMTYPTTGGSIAHQVIVRCTVTYYVEMTQRVPLQAS